MTLELELAKMAFNIVPYFSLAEAEEGCKAFMEDIEEGHRDENTEWLFPYVLDKKLKYYEEEY